MRPQTRRADRQLDDRSDHRSGRRRRRSRASAREDRAARCASRRSVATPGQPSRTGAALRRDASPSLFAAGASLAGDVATFSSANVGGELLLAVTPVAPALRARRQLLGLVDGDPGGLTLRGRKARARHLRNALGVRLFGRRRLLRPARRSRRRLDVRDGLRRHLALPSNSELGLGIDLGATGFWVPFRAFPALALSLTLEAVVATEKPPPFVAKEPARSPCCSSRLSSRRGPFWGRRSIFSDGCSPPRALSLGGAARRAVQRSDERRRGERRSRLQRYPSWKRSTPCPCRLRLAERQSARGPRWGHRRRRPRGVRRRATKAPGVRSALLDAHLALRDRSTSTSCGTTGARFYRAERSSEPTTDVDSPPDGGAGPG